MGPIKRSSSPGPLRPASKVEVSFPLIPRNVAEAAIDAGNVVLGTAKCPEVSRMRVIEELQRKAVWSGYYDAIIAGTYRLD